MTQECWCAWGYNWIRRWVNYKWNIYVYKHTDNIVLSIDIICLLCLAKQCNMFILCNYNVYSHSILCVLYILHIIYIYLGFPDGSVVKNLPATAGDPRDMGSFPGLGRSHGEGNGNQLQYSCLENSLDRGDWRATVQGGHKESKWLSCMNTWGGNTALLFTKTQWWWDWRTAGQDYKHSFGCNVSAVQNKKLFIHSKGG